MQKIKGFRHTKLSNLALSAALDSVRSFTFNGLVCSFTGGFGKTCEFDKQTKNNLEYNLNDKNDFR